jgi:aryl-alcohol dehydrogenase-like predicted oxidoreductase
VVANGRLTDANERAEDRSLVGRLRAVAGGVPLDQLAIAFVAARPFVDVVLSGAATTGQLASHVAALDLEPGARVLANLGRLAEAPARYWATRASLPWS